MGAYKHIKKSIQEVYKERPQYFRERLAQWSKEPPVVRVEKPTNVIRARSLGYKAVKGIVIVRARVKKGLRKRRSPKGGRHPRHNYRYIQPGLNHQAMAEQRAAKKYTNMEVINSYYVGETGNYKFYEVILAERANPNVPKHIQQAASRKGRAFRGLTSAGKKARGLRNRKRNKPAKRA